ncbi:hypothetical protein C8E01_10852 [Pontibacter virosus]|uniref:Uncharacterized protein n=1 Tax=Pontibacter virosus TaxID=1765052 RepID=A0A2U1AUR1_9BACT|nr:hypothetical protein C8E01_10852 [Pontibacter virosus]
MLEQLQLTDLKCLVKSEGGVEGAEQQRVWGYAWLQVSGCLKIVSYYAARLL